MDERTCSKCGALVKIEPVYADAQGEVMCLEIIDVKSICECGNDVLSEVCEFCEGDGCAYCDPNYQP